MKTPVWSQILGVSLCLLGTQAALGEDAAPPAAQPAVEGKGMYRQFCSTCHGVNMVNPGTSSFDLRTFPHDDKPRFLNSVTKGKNSMPAWGDLLKPEEIEAIWAYVLTGGKI